MTALFPFVYCVLLKELMDQACVLSVYCKGSERMEYIRSESLTMISS